MHILTSSLRRCVYWCVHNLTCQIIEIIKVYCISFVSQRLQGYMIINVTPSFKGLCTFVLLFKLNLKSA